MLDNLKKNAAETLNFLQYRWENPLHSDKPNEQQSRLWPSSEEFYHPLNPMFSFFFTKPEHFEFYKVVLLRDGAISLLDFFLRFPVPRGETTFLVPADLMFLVPDAWREQILAYRLECPRPYKATNKLLFYSMISDAALCWPRFKEQMPEWLRQFPRDASVSAYFAVRNEPVDHKWIDRKTAFEFMCRFQPEFSKPPEFLTFEEFKGLLSKGDVTYINMDLWRSGTGLCSVDNIAFGQAAQVFPRATYKGFNGEKLGEWPMSFQHNLIIYKASAEHSDFASFMFMKKSHPTVAVSLPHPIMPTLYNLLEERLTFA